MYVCMYVCTYRGHWSDKCREAKGTGTVVGHMKNFVALGLYLAAKSDPNADRADKKGLQDLLRPRVCTGDVPDLMKAKNLEDLVAHCQVTKTKNKCFVNLMGQDTQDGKLFLELMEKCLAKSGKRQFDPAPPQPVHKDLKIALAEARKKR